MCGGMIKTRKMKQMFTYRRDNNVAITHCVLKSFVKGNGRKVCRLVCAWMMAPIHLHVNEQWCVAHSNQG